MQIEILDITPSTMDEARQRVLDGRFQSGDGFSCACVIALEQTHGRGQRGRSWFARKGESLSATYMVCCRPVTEPGRSHLIGLSAGVALAEVMSRRCAGIEIGLKWPNDLLLNGKKAAGVLVEMMTSPQGVQVALVGVGVNVSVGKFPAELARTATSMAASGVPLAMLPDLRTLAGEIGEALRLQFQECSVDASAGIRRWRRFDATSGRRYLFDEGGAERSGVAEGIDNSGALLLRDEAGTLTAVMSASSLREAPDR